MKTPLLLAAACAAALLAAGCGSACQDLGDRICACQPQGAARDSCRSSIRNELGNVVKPGEAEQQTCENVLKTCPDFAAHSDLCRELDTAAGKQLCGLANPPG